MLNGERVCAALRGKAAAAKLTLAEAILLAIADGCEDRQELAKKHWPGEVPEKAAESLKSQLSHLRSKYKWLQTGRGFLLTHQGFLKVQEMRRTQGDFAGDFHSSDNHGMSTGADGTEVPQGDFAGDLAPTGTETGSPAVSKRRLAPPVPVAKVPKSHFPRRGEPGDFETSGEVI
jgi:hypothetical protein